MKTHEERLALLDEMVSGAAARDLILRTADDEPLGGRTIGLDGRRHVNFGSCSYLGLELDPRMRDAVRSAVTRYGTQFSSSRSYLSAPPYAPLEAALSEMFGGHALVAPSTTLGHLATLPILVGSRAAVVLDQQVHHSVQMATNQLRVQGTAVEVVRHNDMDALEAALERLGRTHDELWYMADGVYSMYADLAPFERLAALLERHPALRLYVDDSHGVGWSGTHGRGPALEALGLPDRMVVAASLNKSFAAAGAAIVFPDPELRRRVRMLGGPMMFSGPIQPPMLGAALASAAIHLSPELPERQAALQERIALCTELLDAAGLPLEARDATPIRYVTVGLPDAAQDVAVGLLGDGLYVNLAHFPAVPMKKAGIRVTLTVHHRPEDIVALVDAMVRRMPGSRPVRMGADRLRLEHHRTVDALDGAEWDELLGDRGSFGTDGLRLLERVFGGPGRPEDAWDFHYFVVRDGRGRPVLATFFTAALWKDDMLSSAAVSARVERRRVEDPYYLTSRTLAMGSLLTEGDHLHLDRSGPWRAALELLLEAVAAEAERAGIGTVVLRDLDGADGALDTALRERGFVAMALPASMVVEGAPADEAAWLASLSVKSRAHQRRDVLPWDDAYDVEVLRRGGRVPSPAEHAHLHGLYRNVQARGLELNSFALPEGIFAAMLEHPGWELVLLRRRDAPGSPPVAFGAHYVGRAHYAPMIVGLDYDAVRSAGAYRQCLRHALRRARELGRSRVLLGIGAELEKRRFGARPDARSAYVQAADHYSQEVLAALGATAMAA